MTTLLLLALGAAMVYIAACAFWPFMACRRCDGAGKHRSPSGRAWRDCPRCAGSGRRVRAGRRLFEILTSDTSRDR